MADQFWNQHHPATHNVYFDFFARFTPQYSDHLYHHHLISRFGYFHGGNPIYSYQVHHIDDSHGISYHGPAPHTQYQPQRFSPYNRNEEDNQMAALNDEEYLSLWNILPDHRNNNIASTTNNQHGLSEETISKHLKTRDNIPDDAEKDELCAVCLDCLFQKDDDKIARLESCGHEYHVGCIKKWLLRKNFCPLYRKLPDETGNYSLASGIPIDNFDPVLGYPSRTHAPRMEEDFVQNPSLNPNPIYTSNVHGTNTQTFAQMLSPGEISKPVKKEEYFSVTMDEEIYQQRAVELRNTLIGRLMLPKGSKPLGLEDLKRRLLEAIVPCVVELQSETMLLSLRVKLWIEQVGASQETDSRAGHSPKRGTSNLHVQINNPFEQCRSPALHYILRQIDILLRFRLTKEEEEEQPDDWLDMLAAQNEQDLLSWNILLDHRNNNIASTTNNQQGLSEETIIKHLKTRDIIPDDAEKDDNYRHKLCSVCLDCLFQEDDKIARLESCGHEYHVGCIKKWLLRKNFCPLCKAIGIRLVN
ncbi:hypothetical protein DH2020_022760 [Rehmannia glutinosa]|uniref:RING-type E3 ubiquitin transferase n=1 Tax=Rehmannia glutinosa TaxID=99300 RepID=A0ABR0W459_REHGL